MVRTYVGDAIVLAAACTVLVGAPTAKAAASGRPAAATPSARERRPRREVLKSAPRGREAGCTWITLLLDRSSEETAASRSPKGARLLVATVVPPFVLDSVPVVSQRQRRVSPLRPYYRALKLMMRFEPERHLNHL